MAAVIINLGSKICRRRRAARGGTMRDAPAHGRLGHGQIPRFPGLAGAGKDLVEQSSRHLRLGPQVLHPGQALTRLFEHLGAERTFAVVPVKGGRVVRAQGFVQRIGDQSFPFVAA